jgi:hypothetical protein
MPTYLEQVIDAYIECALWSSTVGEEGTPMDRDYSIADLAPSTVTAAYHDVAAFIAHLETDNVDASSIGAVQMGHDIWLTRNGHGAGFWDRDLGALGDTLTDIAHSYGEAYWYPGDDGLIYQAGDENT